MKTYQQNLSELKTMLETALGDVADVITDDITQVQSGRLTVFIEPPTLEWERWDEPEVTWSIAIVSGSPWNQARSLEDIHHAIGLLTQAQTINLQRASPSTITTVAGDLAAYDITLNPMD
jgi:hypothetical protein